MSVTARQVSSAPENPGEYRYLRSRAPRTEGNILGLVYRCPCGCGGRGVVFLEGNIVLEALDEDDEVVRWDENEAAPTLGSAVTICRQGDPDECDSSWMLSGDAWSVVLY